MRRVLFAMIFLCPAVAWAGDDSATDVMIDRAERLHAEGQSHTDYWSDSEPHDKYTAGTDRSGRPWSQVEYPSRDGENRTVIGTDSHGRPYSYTCFGKDYEVCN